MSAKSAMITLLVVVPILLVLPAESWPFSRPTPFSLSPSALPFPVCGDSDELAGAAVALSSAGSSLRMLFFPSSKSFGTLL
jgi:hypothetical protein